MSPVSVEGIHALISKTIDCNLRREGGGGNEYINLKRYRIHKFYYLNHASIIIVLHASITTLGGPYHVSSTEFSFEFVKINVYHFPSMAAVHN